MDDYPNMLSSLDPKLDQIMRPAYERLLPHRPFVPVIVCVCVCVSVFVRV